MSQLSFSSFDDVLLARDAQGRYLPASVDQILEAARQAIELKMQRGAEFTSPALVKEFLRNKLAGFEHEVFAVLFLNTRHRLIVPGDVPRHYRQRLGVSARGGQ